MAMCINQCRGQVFLLLKKKSSRAGTALSIGLGSAGQKVPVFSVFLILKATRLALRTRWLWMQRTTENRAWHGLEIPHNDTELPVFKAAAQIHSGNAKNTFFLKDHWLMEYHQHPVEYGPELAQLYLFAATHLSVPGGPTPETNSLGPRGRDSTVWLYSSAGQLEKEEQPNLQ